MPKQIALACLHCPAMRAGRGQRPLFNSSTSESNIADVGVPDIEISEDEYKSNPLKSDVLYWGNWVLMRARERLTSYYPETGKHTSLAYLWARTVKCPNPACGAEVPCVHQLWLCNKTKKKIALKLDLQPKKLTSSFRIVHGRDIDFDPETGTMQRGQAACPFCQTVLNSKYLQAEGNAGRMGQRPLAVVESSSNDRTKEYRLSTELDCSAFEKASAALDAIATNKHNSPVPNEPLKAWSGVFNAPLFGMTTWGSLLNKRQAYSIATFAEQIRAAHHALAAITDNEYATAITTYLAFALDKCLDFSSTLCRWGNDDEGVTGTFGRQALPMVWDYAESNPLQSRTGGFSWALGFVADALTEVALSSRMVATVVQGSATALPYESQQFHCVATDPPYYDAVPYSDLSDYFYVWLKRTVGDLYPQLFRTPLTPKTQEVVSHLGNNYPGNRKTPEDYETGMEQAFAEMRRVVDSNGICVVMFAHKTTTAWEKLIAASVNAGLSVSASWPIHTEGRGRLRAHDSAALAGSISLVCRPRSDMAVDGLWDAVRQELKTVAQERLDFFWSHGIRGADFFISAIGPALSVFSRHRQVTKLSGELVTVGQFLDEVRSLVTSYALAKILKTTHTGTIDPESRFYVVWKWSYADGKVPADESFKLSQALGLDTETLWDSTGVLEKSGENVQSTPVAKRVKIKNLGEPAADGAPASLIDVLHRMCAFREKNDTPGMAEFLARSGQANNHSIWLVAQAVSEILPDGDKEKQLMQGLLNQKEGLEEAAREKRLF